ncbi:hypothetical protein CA13_70360 [Planctomycetes bacterium CA13]|uniref:Uncharacterized protein n=1 Tax=Novipirellula herctigrandis TaxID=2527986 RepID=A0A5C5YNM4_9BACT|nr:hypothetical protein CA13_70360 [Planctomycetes bacterium CA13]
MANRVGDRSTRWFFYGEFHARNIFRSSAQTLMGLRSATMKIRMTRTIGKVDEPQKSRGLVRDGNDGSNAVEKVLSHV